MQPVNLFEYEPLARARVEASAWAYYASGADDELSLRDSHAAYTRIKLRPRVLVDVSSVALATAALGIPIGFPVIVPPMAAQGMAHADGELATARGAGAAGTIMIVATLATRSLEEVAEAASGPLWFQLYVYKDRTVSEALVRRAEAAGYRALVLTVDLPVLGRREADERNAFALPAHLRLANFAESDAMRPADQSGSALTQLVHAEIDPTLTWEAIAWLRSITTLPIVLKGILTAEDAALGVAHGADAIVVSNHGGRQLDTTIAPIEALPEVVAAVNGRCEVYVDGGIRRGTDVLKALALGARAVFVGRPILWGLAVGGADGVAHVLALLRHELEVDMALAGCPALASVGRSLVRLP
ncbi:MAG TPA: alpha-hydroxy acid oxidase [Ktedonobacterales bacterium]|nr:alpha-hydroxy acid oxidase [Ktedonobacterales bacterium]